MPAFVVVEADNAGFQVYDSGGTLIDPAKDATVAAITAAINDAISTSGIKKITDQLPAGTNNIGDVDVASSALPAGAATETTLATLATEAKLEAVRVLLNSLDGKDFATETTQATLATETKLEAVRVLLASIDGKDFATQTTLAALLSAFNAEDFATQVTLAALLSAFNAEDFAHEATLASIKDTDGIKKITDALPVGDNWIGKTKVGDGTNVAALQSIDGVQHLAAGKANILDVANSTVAQLGAAAVFAPTGGTDVSQFASVAITVHSDQDSALDGMVFEFSQNGTDWDDKYRFNLDADTSQTRRFQFPVCARYFRVNYTNGSVTTTELRIQTLLQRNNILTSIHRVQDVVREDRSAQIMKSVVIAQRDGAVVRDFYPVQADVQGNLKVTTIGSDIPSDPSAFVLVFLENGGSELMLVDGSTTPVAFTAGPTVADEVWSIRELLLTFTADDFEFDGESFGSLSALTNGFNIEIVKDSVATEVFVVKQNEDFLRVPGRTPLVNNTGPKDVLGASLSFDGLILSEATGDIVRINIRDNLVNVKLKYLTATLFAAKVI